MDTKDKKIFNVKEAYKHFVENATNHNKNKAKKLTPDYMYEQYNKRADIISAIDDLCFTFEDNSTFIISIFNYGMMRRNGNAKMQKEDIDVLLNLVLNFIVLISNKNEIDKWRIELKGINKTLNKMEIYNLNADELTDNKKLLDKVLNILTKKK